MRAYSHASIAKSLHVLPLAKSRNTEPDLVWQKPGLTTQSNRFPLKLLGREASAQHDNVLGISQRNLVIRGDAVRAGRKTADWGKQQTTAQGHAKSRGDSSTWAARLVSAASSARRSASRSSRSASSQPAPQAGKCCHQRTFCRRCLQQNQGEPVGFAHGIMRLSTDEPEGGELWDHFCWHPSDEFRFTSIIHSASKHRL